MFIFVLMRWVRILWQYIAKYIANPLYIVHKQNLHFYHDCAAMPAARLTGHIAKSPTKGVGMNGGLGYDKNWNHVVCFPM